MNPATLIAHFHRLAEAPDAIPRLRRFILDLAVRGKLVPQDPKDEPAVVVASAIARERLALSKTTRIPGDIEQSSSDDVPYTIASNWLWTKLGNIALQIQYGYTASADPSVTEVRMLRITDIQNNRVDWPLVPGCQISLAEAEKYLLNRNDILIARTGGTIGKSFIVPDAPVKSVFASYLIRVVPPKAILAQYLKLYLESSLYWTQLSAMSAGTGQPNVNGQALGKLKLPLPPLAEQKRIVAKVDELMALCDRLEAAQTEREQRRQRLAAATHAGLAAAETEADTAAFFLQHFPRLTTRLDQIPQLRQTILNLAVRGKLVKQDKGDEPAAKLLKTIQAERVCLLKDGQIKKQDPCAPINDIPYVIPKSWEWIRFGELIHFSDAGISPKTEGFPRSGSEWGVLKVSAVSWDYFKPDENKQLYPGSSPPESAQVRAGDFLISRANTSDLVAKCVIVESEPHKLVLSDKIVRLRITKHSEPKFLWMVNNYANYARQFYATEASGTSHSMKNVSRSVIYALPLPLPPLAEQKRIVARVEELMGLCDRLEAQTKTTQTDSRRFLEAVLHSALAG